MRWQPGRRIRGSADASLVSNLNCRHHSSAGKYIQGVASIDAPDSEVLRIIDVLTGNVDLAVDHGFLAQIVCL